MADAKKLILNSDIFTWRPLATILSDNVCSVPFAVKDKLVIGKRPGFGFIQVKITLVMNISLLKLRVSIPIFPKFD